MWRKGAKGKKENLSQNEEAATIVFGYISDGCKAVAAEGALLHFEWQPSNGLREC